jgi:4-amino-4-deoxy-L-arabinose transferase-like glycosyltransferase
VLLIGCLLAGALLLRIDGITRPSLATRELHNALLAREYYLGDGAGLPLWKQHVLRELPNSVTPVEPPVLDHLAAFAFRVTGGEHLWMPRLASTLMWLVGGMLLYLIGVRVTTRDGAVVALALYLVWPYGVLISRLYMPDPTMIALLLGAALTVIRYWEHPSTSRLVFAGFVSSVATAVKPGVAIIFLVALFVALAASRRALLAAIVRGRLALFMALASSLAAAYYVYGTYVHDFLSGQSEGRVEPHRLMTDHFWRGWWEMVSIVLPFPQRQALVALVPLVAGLAGILAARPGSPRGVLVGLWLGYIAYALVFAAYTASHAYYALPLIPILAISIGALAGVLLVRLDKAMPIARRAFIGFIALVVAVAIFKSRPAPANYGPITDYRRIGEITHHTTHAIIVDERLKSPAMYWGWIIGEYWYPPTPSQNLPASGDPFPPGIDAGHATFLIVVGVGELETEERLRKITGALPVVARNSRYAVFDLRGGRALAAASVRG